MIIDNPSSDQIPALKALWKEAFGDGDDAIDVFFATAYSDGRCITAMEDGVLNAAAYYFRCTAYGKPIAYIYAVAVAKRSRGRGVCRALMAETDRRLSHDGYAGAVLVPADGKLFAMYEKLGYSEHIRITETCVSEEILRTLLTEKISVTEYARLRRKYLPDGGVVQEGENLAYLSANADFYRTRNGVACVFSDLGRPVSAEVLGEDLVCDVSPKDCNVKIRTAGSTKPFALYKSFDGSCSPTYFGIAFD